MAGNIVATNYISLDGVIEDPVGMESSGLGNWTGPFKRGPVGDKFKLEELKAAESMIYGRKTYDGFAAVWPTLRDPDGFAELMNAMPKYLASSTVGRAEWNNTTVWSDDLVAKTKELKARSSRDILIYGSASIVHQLMPHGLVDEYRLMVYPTVLGRGKRLFPDDVASMLTLTECTLLGGGIALLKYRNA